MRLYVVRHGQTDYNKAGRIQGQIDIHLNSEGIKQAEEVSKKFQNVKVDIIISSTLSRAYDTAKIISKVLDVKEIIKSDKIIERSFGELEGKILNEDIEWSLFTDTKCNYLEYGVETIPELYKRVSKFLEELYKEYKDKTILLVTHCGIIQVIESYFRGFPKSGNIEEYSVKNAEVKIYEKN